MSTTTLGSDDDDEADEEVAGEGSEKQTTDDEESDSPASASTSLSFTSALKPTEVVKALDDHIVGQGDAKRAVAIALRNRWRRKQLPDEFKPEVLRSPLSPLPS